MTTKQIRIRLTTDELAELNRLAEEYDISATALSAIFVKASVRAVRENGGRLALPLRFKVEEGKPRK